MLASCRGAMRTLQVVLSPAWACCRGVLLLQSWWRMLGCRRAFLRQRAAAIHVQAAWRGLAARRAYVELRTCHYAALILQTAWRGFRARRSFLHAVSCAMCIQMAWRRTQVLYGLAETSSPSHYKIL